MALTFSFIFHIFTQQGKKILQFKSISPPPQKKKCEIGSLVVRPRKEILQIVRLTEKSWEMAVCTLATERIRSVLLSFFFFLFFFFCDYNGSLDTLANEHICKVQFVCHRSEQIGSTRESVCRSLYVGPFFAWFAINDALKEKTEKLL